MQPIPATSREPLKTLGFTRRQLAVTLAWQAIATAVIGIVIGVPLGMAAGRSCGYCSPATSMSSPNHQYPCLCSSWHWRHSFWRTSSPPYPAALQRMHRPPSYCDRNEPSPRPIRQRCDHQVVGATPPRFSSDDSGPQCRTCGGNPIERSSVAKHRSTRRRNEHILLVLQHRLRTHIIHGQDGVPPMLRTTRVISVAFRDRRLRRSGETRVARRSEGTPQPTWPGQGSTTIAVVSVTTSGLVT